MLWSSPGCCFTCVSPRRVIGGSVAGRPSRRSSVGDYSRVATVLRSEFRPLPPQRAFLASKAMIRGYGGAVGGGKSRTGCEAVFNECLDHPGLIALIARDAHTSIVETTKKTMLEQVIPHELITHRKASMGED